MVSQYIYQERRSLHEEDDLTNFLGNRGENGSVVIDPEMGRTILVVADAKTCIVSLLFQLRRNLC